MRNAEGEAALRGKTGSRVLNTSINENVVSPFDKATLVG